MPRPTDEFFSKIDPFMALNDVPLNLAVPPACFDAYTWIAYLANGARIAEFDADEPAGSWTKVDRIAVIAIDLLPLGFKCSEHPQYVLDCTACRLSINRGALRPHRMMVPQGGNAYFERRRLISEDNQHRMTWTILGFEQTIINDKRNPDEKIIDLGARTSRVSYYIFFDDLGRSFMSSDISAV